MCQAFSSFVQLVCICIFVLLVICDIVTVDSGNKQLHLVSSAVVIKPSNPRGRTGWSQKKRNSKVCLFGIIFPTH